MIYIENSLSKYLATLAVDPGVNGIYVPMAAARLPECAPAASPSLSASFHLQLAFVDDLVSFCKSYKTQ